MQLPRLLRKSRLTSAQISNRVTSTNRGTAFIIYSRDLIGKANRLRAFLLNWVNEIGRNRRRIRPARGLSSSQICTIYEFLETIDAMVLRKRFNTTKMEELEIYQNYWTRDPEAEFAYLVEFLDPLKDFIFIRFAKRKMGAVVQLA